MTPRNRKKPENLNNYGVSNDIRGGWWMAYDVLAATAIGAVKVVGLFNKRLGNAVRGRDGGVNRWRIGIFDDRPSLLIHTASRGEFESVCPLIDALNDEGKYRIAVSFSSPSVEKAVLNYPGLWAAGYLPFDQLGEQLRFLTRLEPSIILVAKHDIWPNMIRAAATLRIPYILLNANFHSKTKRKIPVVSNFNRRFLNLISEILTISENDSKRIRPLLKKSVKLSALGDTRYDRTLQRASKGRDRFKELKDALGDGPVIVAGSSWPPEEKIIFDAFAKLVKINPSCKLVLAPHEIGDESLNRCRKAANENGLSVQLHSEWKSDKVTANIYYIDAMGVLADVYAVGWAAIVGGGFGVGVHSVLEPAAHGLPVAFGPNYHVSHEAGLLLQSGGGSILTDADALLEIWMSWIKNPASYQKAASSALEVVNSNSGATAKVLERLEFYLRQN